MTIARRGLVIAAAMLLAVSCGDDELPTAGSEVPSTILSTVRTTTTAYTTPESPPSMQSSTARSDGHTTLSATTATTMLTSSSLDVAADPVAGVLAAAAAYWLSSHAAFTTLHVVERLGRANDGFGFVEYSDNAPQMTSLQRGAIEAALAPRLVTWTHDLESVAGPAVTVPPEQAVVMFAEPTIDGGHAEVVVNLWCGMVCGGGIGLVLERSSADEWRVTDQFGGFVA